MKQIKYIISLLAIAFALNACQEKPIDVPLTDVGPVMSNLTVSESVYMGANIKFSVDLSDKGFALSTLKAELYFDEDLVASKTIRTKEYGHYSDVLLCPLLANIPDGEATLIIKAQNVGLGITSEEFSVEVTRPNFDKLYLKADNKTYTMVKEADYVYRASENFPAQLNAMVVSPAVNSDGDVITLGWDGEKLSPETETEVPFSMKNAGVYDVTVDLLNLTASPFGKVKVNLAASNPVAIVNLMQGSTIEVAGVTGIFAWNIDFDFFTLEEDNTLTFKPIDGLYRLEANHSAKFIRVDMMKSRDEYARMDIGNPHASAVYAIGEGIGKPTSSNGADWDTTKGAWCLAQHEENVYQITFIAGASCPLSGLNWKIFENRGWDGNFNYAEVNVDDLVKISDDGNIVSSTEPLVAGTGYTFKFDLNGGPDNVILNVEEADLPASDALDIKVNDAQAQMITADKYVIPVVSMTKGQIPTVSGIDNVMSWYFDPDYFDSSYQFAAESGYYSVEIYLDKQFFLFKKALSDGSRATFTNGNALWLMAWGVAAHTMAGVQTEGGELAFTPGTSFCMAEVSPRVYRFTGTAVEEDDELTIGGRFRYDYLSVKYFGQDGWGLEKGAMFDGSRLVYTTRAAALIEGDGSDNFGLKEGVELELGETYVLEIDLSVDGVETIDFYKQ